MGLRAEVYDLDGGRCVGCGKRLPRGGDIWSWHVHHVIPKNVLKARGCKPRWWRGPAICVLTCRRCHERHTSWTAPIPFEKLPPRVHKPIAVLGPWAQDLLVRYHPPIDIRR